MGTRATKKRGFTVTPQLQRIVDTARSLSLLEQLELLQALSSIIQQTNRLETQSSNFWKTPSIDQLIEEQQPPIVSDVSLLGIDFWMSDESNDEFLAFLHQQRQAESIETQ